MIVLKLVVQAVLIAVLVPLFSRLWSALLAHVHLPAWKRRLIKYYIIPKPGRTPDIYDGEKYWRVEDAYWVGFYNKWPFVIIQWH